MLKRALCGAVLLFFAASPAGALAQQPDNARAQQPDAAAEQPARLIVGNVRDEAGEAIEGASVEAFAADGSSAGSGLTDRRGTFALRLRTEAERVTVHCRYCAPATLAPERGTAVTIVVARSAALASGLPSAADAAALPYGRIADTYALAPFIVRSAGGVNVSDRGLGGGRGLVLDALAPVADLATGRSGFEDVPDRYTRSLALVPASQAYRYASGAGGGGFAIDQLDPQRSGAVAETGQASAFVLQPSLGIVHPSAGLSSDDGRIARRADLDIESGFAGGTLRAGLAAASASTSNAYAAASDFRALRIAYAAASRRYRTFGSFSASALDVAAATGATAYRSSYLGGSFRIEHPAALELDAGATVQQGSASYIFPLSPEAYDAAANVASSSLYLEAHSATPRLLVDAALALQGLSEREALPDATLDGSGFLLLPSLAAKLQLGGALYARAGYSHSARAPALVEAAASARPLGTFERTRDKLAEAAFGYDAGGRIRSELMIFRESSDGFGEGRLDGIGVNLVWQVAPRVSVRAWTLRDNPSAGRSAALDLSRQVLWATYEAPGGLRLDTIARRSAAIGGSAVDLDADATFPLQRRTALSLGTSRHDGLRHYALGLRFQ